MDNARFDTAALERLAGRSKDSAGQSSLSFIDRLTAGTKDDASDDSIHHTQTNADAGLDRGGLDRKLYQQCEELETFIIKILIKSMRGTVQKSSLIDSGLAGGMYEDMLYDEYAKSYSKNAGFGFAKMAYDELTGRRAQVDSLTN
jgi:flagellar protein FlgJ